MLYEVIFNFGAIINEADLNLCGYVSILLGIALRVVASWLSQMLTA